MTRDEGRTLFNRLFARVEVADRYTPPRVEAPRYLGQVYNGGSIPTVAGRVYLTRPVDVAVNDTEGAVPVFTPDTSVSVPVLCIGGVATAGTNLIAEEIDGRWVADLRGASGAVCGGTVFLNFKCGGINQSGVSVTITQGATSFSGTTNASGNVSFSPGASGTWSITATKAGLSSYSGTFVFSCANTTISVTMLGASNTISGIVLGCNSRRIPSATVEMRLLGTLYATATTNGLGEFSAVFAGPTGTYTVTAIKSTFANSSTPAIVGSCNGTSGGHVITMSPDTGYVCFSCHDWDATSTSATLTLTVSWAGTQSLSYDSGSGRWLSADYAYTGTLYTDASLTTTATLTATIKFVAATSAGSGYEAWFLKTTPTTFRVPMDDTFVAANPTLVERRTISITPSVCANVSPLNLSYGFNEPNVPATIGTATLTE